MNEQSFSQRWTLIGLVVACVLIELILQLATLVELGGRLRQTVYEFGGFWPGLLYGWRPNYPGQALAMFFTYAFLHAGIGHLVVNMITLWSLGQGVILRAGGWGFVLIYAGSIFGGALGYAFLASSPQPMVGASGALFGLAGAVLAWTYLDQMAQGQGLWAVGRVAFFLLAINVVMYWALDGHLAWQTHLGGAVMGALLALWLERRRPI